MKIKEAIKEILQKHAEMQTNLMSESAQEQISIEIVKVIAENIDDPT